MHIQRESKRSAEQVVFELLMIDLQSLFCSMSRDVHNCTHWLRPRNSPPPPAFGLVLRGRCSYVKYGGTEISKVYLGSKSFVAAPAGTYPTKLNLPLLYYCK
jgi:hypothetical protein